MAPWRDVIHNSGRATGIVSDGTGPVILVVPDPHQRPTDWFDPALAGALTDRFTVAVVDLAPHGEEPASSQRFHPEAVVEDLREMLRYREIGRAVAWGFGGGASFAATLARRRPDLICGLIIGSVSVGDPRGQYEGIAVDRDALITRLVQAIRENDWEAYFDAVPWATSAEMRKKILADCREEDIVAALKGELMRPNGVVLPVGPAFVYWGDREPFHSSNVSAVESLPVQWATVPGNRGDVMQAGSLLEQELRHFLLKTVSV